MESIRRLGFHDLGFAKVDHHRPLRKGMPEVIYGEGKSAGQIIGILESLEQGGDGLLVTRCDAAKAAELSRRFPDGIYHDLSRLWTMGDGAAVINAEEFIMVCCAGTSDLPVAEEAAVTARFLGHRVERAVDVGVAGLHRLMACRAQLESARVIIAVAGMEAALASVIAGLVRAPVVAVPTSVGYGASFGGLAALLGLLNGCAPGVTVVNIDNGFGAAVAASLMCRT